MNLYQYVQSNPVGSTDPYGLKCCPGKCDRWKISIDTFGTVAVVAGGIFRTGLHPSGDCDISDQYRFPDGTFAGHYTFLGGGIGVGIEKTLSIGSDVHEFKTECITWEDHKGLGRITSVGIGAVWTIGAVFLDTPQTYESFYGVSFGIDLSAFTSIGYWGFTP